MKIYILKKDWNGCTEGTRIFFQSGMYYMKTVTENELWLTVEEVEDDIELFRPITALEFFFYTYQINA